MSDDDRADRVSQLAEMTAELYVRLKLVSDLAAELEARMAALTETAAGLSDVSHSGSLRLCHF